jgi:hypothetical protein
MQTIQDLLRADRSEILEEAATSVACLEHYRRDGRQVTRDRLEALYAEVARAVDRRDLAGIVAHAVSIARERWEAGFEYVELLSAFTALEAAIHRRTARELPPGERALGLGLVGTAFAHGRKALTREFGALGSSPALDLTPLFTGPYCDADGRPAAESVYPV